MEESIKEKFQQLHEDGQHQEILELIEQYDMTDTADAIFLKTQQGRALNNLGRVDEGLPILLEVDQLEGESNADTKYRIAYSYVHMDRPIEYSKYFDQCLAIDPEHEWALEIIEHIKENHHRTYMGNPPLKNKH